MADWKEMYLNLMKDTEKTIRILEAGQKKSEEMFLRDEGLLPDVGSSQIKAANEEETEQPDNEDGLK